MSRRRYTPYIINRIMMRIDSRVIIITTRGEGSPTHTHTEEEEESESGFIFCPCRRKRENHHHSREHNTYAISNVLLFLHCMTRSSTPPTACAAFHSQRIKRNAHTHTHSLSLSLLYGIYIYTHRERERERVGGGQMRDAPHVQQPRHFV